MSAWIRFFVGTPKRFMWTVAGLFVLTAALFPDLAQRALFNVLNAFFGAIAPLEGPLLTLAIVVFGLYIMFKPYRKKRRGNH
jgi:hypothetical protein